METVEELLGPRPTVRDYLGAPPPSDFEREMSRPVRITAEDNLERAARDWTRLQAAQPEMARLRPAQAAGPDLPVFEPPAGVFNPYQRVNRAGQTYLVEPSREEQERFRKEEQFGYELDDSILPLGTWMRALGRAQMSGAEEGPVGETVSESLEATFNGLTTPRNIGYMLASLGIASTGPLASRLVAALWTGVMGHQVSGTPGTPPPWMNDLAGELAKPEGERDPRVVTRSLADSGTALLFTAWPATHLVGSGAARALARRLNSAVDESPMSKVQGPMSGLEEEAARGGVPTVEQLLGPRPGGPEPIPIKPPVEPKAPVARVAGRQFRPVVPETAAEAERGLSVTQEIRQKGAKTLREIQDLFPARELTREEARDLRDATWTKEELAQKVTKATKELPTDIRRIGPLPEQEVFDARFRLHNEFVPKFGQAELDRINRGDPNVRAEMQAAEQEAHRRAAIFLQRFDTEQLLQLMAPENDVAIAHGGLPELRPRGHLDMAAVEWLRRKGHIKPKPEDEKGAQDAIDEGTEPEGGEPEHPGTPPGPDVPGNAPQAGQAAGGPAGGGERPVAEPEEVRLTAQQVLVRQNVEAMRQLTLAKRQEEEVQDPKSEVQSQEAAPAAEAAPTAAEPQRAPAKVAAAAPVTPKGRGRVGMGVRARKLFDKETEVNGPDILSWMAENMKLLSAKQALKAWGRERWTRNRDLYDGAVPLEKSHHNVIYDANGSAPDVVAQTAFEDGVLKEPSVDALWAAIERATKARSKVLESEARQKRWLAEEAEQAKRWRAEKVAGEVRVDADEMVVGDEMDLAGERLRVAGIDADTGEVTLDDGKRFGKQKLESGESIYVERLDPVPEGQEGFGPAEMRETSPKSKVQGPKSLASATNLDALAKRVHGRGYAELEDWQQQAIRQAVERGTVLRREQPGAASGRERALAGEQPGAVQPAAGTAGALPPATAAAEPRWDAEGIQERIESLLTERRQHELAWKQSPKSYPYGTGRPQPASAAAVNALSQMRYLDGQIDLLQSELDRLDAGGEQRGGQSPRSKVQGPKSQTPPPSGQAPPKQTRPGATSSEISYKEGPAGQLMLMEGGKAAGGKGPVSESREAAQSPTSKVQGPKAKGPTPEERLAARARRRSETALRAQEQKQDAPLTEAAKELQKAEVQAGWSWWRKAARVLDTPSAYEPGRVTKLVLRARMGAEYGAWLRADAATRVFKREFDRTPTPRGYEYPLTVPKLMAERGLPDTPANRERIFQEIKGMAGPELPRNWEVQRAIDSGDLDNLTPSEQAFRAAARRLLDEQIEQVQEVSPNSLRDLYTNYFPRLFKDPAQNRGAIEEWLRRRPLEGNKNFLKQRMLEDWMDAIRLGLEPLHDNPVDALLARLGEMAKFVATRKAIAELKGENLWKFVYVYEGKPQGWVQVDDPSATVLAPPVVHVKEAFDAQVRAKTIEALQAWGVPHRRLNAIGGRRWGYADPETGEITTKFGGPDFVIWHEAGHILDARYPELRRRLGADSPQSKLGRELAALADKRFEGQEVETGYKRYVRKSGEKLANVFDAYVRAPELFQKTAPGVWLEFDKFLHEHPEVKGPLDDIKPSLTLGVETSQQRLAGPVVLGHWMAPEPVGRVFKNYLSQGIASQKWYGGLRALNSLQISMRLFGFFHGGMVTTDASYGGLGLALNEALRGHFISSGKELGKAVAMVPRSIRLGYQIRRAMRDPESMDAESRQLAQYALDANLRTHIGLGGVSMSRAWGRAAHEMIQTPSTGAAWEIFWRTPFALMQQTMRPVMEYLVPWMKYGQHGLQTLKILADNPNLTPLELRHRLAQSADSVEDRLGQVTYDNLFQRRAAKDVAQLGLTAYGWHLTKYRMALGGLTDWARAAKAVASGQKPDITFRMTYLPAMVMGHALIGGTIHYFLTGRRPDKLIDYLFPESGLFDQYGKPVRLAIADYIKDLARDVMAFKHGSVKGLLQEQVSRLVPAANELAEMYRDKDFWGEEIFSGHAIGEPELDYLRKTLGEGAAYLAKSSLPFSVTAGERLKQAGASKVGTAGPWFGIVPASKAVTQSAAEALSAEYARADLPAMTHEKAAHNRMVAELVRDIRTGKVNTEGEFEKRSRAAKVKDQAELTRITERVLWTPMQYQIHKMQLEKAMHVFDLAKPDERVSLAPFLKEKIQAAADSGRLDVETAQRYARLVGPWYVEALKRKAQKGNGAPGGGAGRQPAY